MRTRDVFSAMNRQQTLAWLLLASAGLASVLLGRWLLAGGYRRVADHSLSGLATPARIALLTTLVSLALAGLLWLAAEVLP